MQGGNFFHLAIVTPASALYEGQVQSCRIPTSQGLIGVMAHHAPLMALLGYGILTVKEEHEGPAQEFVIDGGFLEIKNNIVTVLANSGQPCESVNADAARAEFEQALAAHAAGEVAVQRRMERIQAARTRVNYTSRK